MLTRDQIYIIVRETTANFGIIPPTMTQPEFEQLLIADLRLEATNITSGTAEIEYMIRLQAKFKTQGYQVNLNENDIFKNPKVITTGNIIDLCANSVTSI